MAWACGLSTLVFYSSDTRKDESMKILDLVVLIKSHLTLLGIGADSECCWTEEWQLTEMLASKREGASY